MLSSFLARIALAVLGFTQVWASGHEHLAVVPVFSTDEEVLLLNESATHWDTAPPCMIKSTSSMIDLILVYSKDLFMKMKKMANDAFLDLEHGFQMKHARQHEPDAGPQHGSG